MDRPTQDHHLVITIIRAIADPLIAAGATDLEVRAAVYQQTGLGIGGGGGAGTTNTGRCVTCGKPVPGGGHDPECEEIGPQPPCPYCGATGGGGHGGLCPNA